jgi:hypothetical protein
LLNQIKRRIILNRQRIRKDWLQRLLRREALAGEGLRVMGKEWKMATAASLVLTAAGSSVNIGGISGGKPRSHRDIMRCHFQHALQARACETQYIG